MTDTLRRCPTPPSRRSWALVLLTLSSAATAGCASRAAPFDNLDKAQVTILKLQAPQQQAQPQPSGLPQIPGIPPELQQLGQQTLEALQQQGLLPPGLIPGLPGAPTTPQPQLPMFRGQWAIADSRPVMDEKLREQLLDLFGDKASFNDQRGNCFFPGMAVSFQSPEYPEPVDVVVSFSCNQAVGYGFQWPHPQSGLTRESHQTLTNIYQQNFGPVPPGA